MAGESSTEEKQGVQSVTPPWMTNTSQTSIPVNQDQLNMIASQLAAGGYGDSTSILAAMSPYYAPVQMTQFGTSGSGSTGGTSGKVETVAELPTDATLIPNSSFSHGGYDYNQYKLSDGTIVNYSGTDPNGSSSSSSSSSSQTAKKSYGGANAR